MGQVDIDVVTDDSLETRELAWELQQSRPERQRIRFLLEQSANLRRAMELAQVREEDLTRKPVFKALHLEKHLH